MQYAVHKCNPQRLELVLLRVSLRVEEFFFLYFRKQNYFFCKCNTTVVYFIASVVAAPFSFSSQMVNHCRQQNTTLSLAVLTPGPSECIVWLTIFGIEAAAMVAVNTVEIIIYMRESAVFANATSTW